MRTEVFYTFVVTALIIIFVAIFAQSSIVIQETALRYQADGSATPAVTATAWGIADTHEGSIVVGHRTTERFPVASLTKLVTALVVYTEPIGGHELLFPLLLASSNGVAEALAERVGRDVFIQHMNEKVGMLDMRHSVFVDPSGLGEGNQSTIADMARLYAYLFEHHRHVIDITSLSRYLGTDNGWINNNPLVGSGGYYGGKHGYTDEAGYTFVGGFQEEMRDGNTGSFVFVLFDSANLVADVATLRTYVQEHVRLAQ